MSTTYQHSTIGRANELFQHGPLIDYLPEDAPCYVALADDGACCVVPYSGELREDGLDVDLRGMADRGLDRLRGRQIVAEAGIVNEVDDRAEARGGGGPASAPKGPPGVGSSEVSRVQNFPATPGSETRRRTEP